MHTYRAPKTQQHNSADESNQESSFTSLQKIVICIFLVLTLLLLPVYAVPVSETEVTESVWKCKNPNPHICKKATLNLPPTEILLPSGQGLKLRTVLKNQADVTPGYSGEISSTGDVFFSQSPVVTGLHLQEGIRGHVRLQIKPETSRPEFCHVYQVFSLSLENYPIGSETVIRYTLPLSEIEEKGYNPVDITLCIYEDNIWQKLYTIYSMDDQNAYFESVTTSLGTFAIVTDGNPDDEGSFSVRINTESVSPVTLDISPTCFVTHPVSYSATV